MNTKLLIMSFTPTTLESRRERTGAGSPRNWMWHDSCRDSKGDEMKMETVEWQEFY